MSKRLFRSKKNRMVAGICGGIGEYFNVDPTIIRLGTALLMLTAGFGLVMYLIAWLIIPENPKQ